MEQRRFSRAPLGVNLLLSTAGELVEARGRDISLRGMFVETRLRPGHAAVLTIQVAFPGSPDEFEIDARVQWQNPDGIGLQFLSLGARATHLISEIIKARPDAKSEH